MSLFIAGCNPFAPVEDFSDIGNDSPISDQSTIEGVFQNMKYAYTFKDTLIYGKIMSDDFVFTYRDYDAGYDVSWGRNEEMRITHTLFKNCERLDLIWNNVVLSSGDSVSYTQIRSFNLLITFNPSDIVRIDGRVNLNFVKKNNEWKISRWLDESNF